MSTRMIRTVAVMMIAAILNLSLYQTAAAAVIGTSDAMQGVFAVVGLPLAETANLLLAAALALAS